ncbi:efflux RND transporter periplasmic adaptor subunit [Gilliamella sp. B3791]|uniref:HlyD family secretion protein n=1 Tax=unclassified Gilliamella TaxID=2685620 RepID=UPI0022698993|nr:MULTISPECIES: efflux RND transporter periplasmic adaptor subunit [unclassified Gilliamella]MCX8642711.1 efflux RND transporter periplasmic adaptor subunit [Gilliamella sp. B3835]MCX8708059.1 efflux RND transporter periplasmic adaptor subunit [Gilliamella sp. B3783]MCX8709051.1 efflux RND transporter periplasmic adaptor subunit [Gilliamella sp. B3780]MCX8717254.1 efflux RND transporter periplasmic adaptor subunit [Gilliamella sp. B3784]MCX8719634.1 efflux RND transporter periplasmic adaptor 
MNKRTFIIIALIVILISMTILIRSHNNQLILQGEVDAPNVSISSKAKGRVQVINVNRGDDVKPNQIVITLDSPELLAQVKAAEAARDQAQAQVELSEHGTREESIRYYEALLKQATVDYNNASKEYERNKAISSKGFVSQSILDNALKTRDAAFQQVQSAQANLDQAKNGDRVEQRQIYDAQLKQAEEQLKQLQIQYDDLKVKAPVEGEIGSIPAEVGELFNANSPLLTIIRLPQAYFVFNLRENIMPNIHKGDHVKLEVPALGNKEVEAEIRYIAPMGDYATKRATRATGDFDLKTFEVRLYPTTPIAGLRAGMSTLWKLDN